MNANSRVLAEQAEWDRVSAELAPDGVLISASRYVGDSRVYRSGDSVVKIRRLGAGASAGVAPLRHEARIIRRVGRSADAGVMGDWEYLRTQYLSGSSPQVGWMGYRDRLRLLVTVWGALSRLHTKGITHGDIRGENLLILSLI